MTASRARATAPRDRRRQLLTLAATLALAAALLWLGFGGRSRVPEKTATGADSAGAAAPTGTSTSAHGGGGPARPRPSSSVDLARNAPPGTLAVPNPLRIMNEPSPYPPWCQPLAEGSDPARTIKDDNPIDEKSGLHVVMGPRKFVVHPPDPIVIDLSVQNALGGKLAIGSGIARFRPDGSTVESGPWFEAPFVDDGTGADLGAGDHDYTAAFVPSDEQRAILFKGGSHVMIEVAFEAPDNHGLMRYPLVVTYSRQPTATLDGQYSDAPGGGGLTISVGVNAEQAGTYRLIGSLYSGDGQRAIAFASARATLAAGDGAIPLSFFGKVLHDAGIDGPYDLRFLMLYEQVSEGNEIAGDTVDNAYTTAAYRASSFSGDAYQAPASDQPVVDMNSPSQQGKPPPLFDDPHAANHAVSSPPQTVGRGPATK